jgi:molecular chaperone HscB
VSNVWTLLIEGDALPRASSFASLTAFERLGLDQQYDLDPATLEKNYIDLSRLLHPDVHTSKGPREMTRAVALTASLNSAYATLKDQILRSECLLKIHGGPDSAEDKSTPAGFLIEMMEYREAYEDSRDGEDQAAIAKIQADLTPERDSAVAAIRGHFLAAEQGSELNTRAIRMALNTLKYYDNLIGELQQALNGN